MHKNQNDKQEFWGNEEFRQQEEEKARSFNEQMDPKNLDKNYQEKLDRDKEIKEKNERKKQQELEQKIKHLAYKYRNTKISSHEELKELLVDEIKDSIIFKTFWAKICGKKHKLDEFTKDILDPNKKIQFLIKDIKEELEK